MKIYNVLLLTALLLLAGVSGVMAQRHTNLSLSITSPVSGDTIENSSSSQLQLRLINNGPDTFLLTDTLYIFGSLMNNLPANARLKGSTSQSLPPGDTAMLSLPVTVGIVNNRTQSSDTTMELCMRIVTGNLLDIPIATDVLDTLSEDNEVCITITFKGLPPTGISDRSPLQHTLDLYPNPAINTVNFETLLKSDGPIKATISDMTGRNIIVRNFDQKKAGKTSQSLDVSSLEPGIYLVEVRAGDQLQTGKLCIRR